MKKKQKKDVVKMPYMTGSIDWNSFYDCQYKRTHEPIKRIKNRAAYNFIRKWADQNVHTYMDDEAMRQGDSPYSSYEMCEIAEHAFIMGRVYGRTERAEEKNKEIRNLKKKIQRLELILEKRCIEDK